MKKNFPPKEGAQSVQTILTRSAAELAGVRQLLGVLESDVLAAAKRQKLASPERLVAMQNIDLMAQIVTDLTRYLAKISEALPANQSEVNVSNALIEVKLRAVAQRLSGQPKPVLSLDSDQPASSVSFF